MKSPFSNATVVVLASVVLVGVVLTFAVILYRGLTTPYEVEPVDEPAPPGLIPMRLAEVRRQGAPAVVGRVAIESESRPIATGKKTPDAPDRAAGESESTPSEIEEVERPPRLMQFLGFNGRVACGYAFSEGSLHGAVVTKDKHIEIDPLEGEFLAVPIGLSAGGKIFYGNSLRKDPNAVEWKPRFGCVNKQEVRSAVRWQDFKPVPLGTLGGANSEALGGTDDHVSVGWSQGKSGDIHAFIHSDANGMRDINPKGYQSQACAIDVRGDRQIVVGRVTPDDGKTWMACRWVNGQFEPIGPKEKSSAARGVSGSVAVGWVEESGSPGSPTSRGSTRVPAIWKEGADTVLITAELLDRPTLWSGSSVAEWILSDGTVLIKDANSGGFFSLKSSRIRKLFGLAHR